MDELKELFVKKPETEILTLDEAMKKAVEFVKDSDFELCISLLDQILKLILNHAERQCV